MKNKELIEWEELEEETEQKEKNKIIKTIEILLSKISIISGFIESFIFIFIALKIKNENMYWLIPLAIGIYLLYLAGVKVYKVWKSKKIIIYEENNKRIIGHEGAPGSGKTSLMCLVASIMNRPIFSSAPLKINGKYTYKLTKEMILMENRLPYGSVIILDEITLYYDNNNSKNLTDEIECLEIEMQLIRHFFDGNMLTASVDMNRLVKRLEEKHGLFRHLLGQESINNSFIIDPIIILISNIFKLDVNTGIRKWTYQTFENINHTGYIFDLSRQDASVKNAKFANLNEIYAYNNNLKFEYDDRYFKNLYLKIPKAELVKWDSLYFNYEELKGTGFKDITNFFEKVYKRIDTKSKNNEIVNK